MATYPWAVNKLKLLQAEKFVTDFNKAEALKTGKDPEPASEEAVKARYVALAGLLAEDAPAPPKKVKNI